MINDVDLPGFLKGKRYGDFRTDETYQPSLGALLHALGPVEATPPATPDEVEMLREELKAVRALAEREAAAARRASLAAFQGKSDALKAAI